MAPNAPQRPNRPPKWYDKGMTIKKGAYVRNDSRWKSVGEIHYNHASSDSRPQASDIAPDEHDIDTHVVVSYRPPVDLYRNWNDEVKGDTSPPTPTGFGIVQPEQGQQKLFDHYNSPGSATVVSMGGTNTTSAKVAGMNLLGIAQNDAMERGYSLTPDTDLSEHSDNLVNRLKGKGAVDEGFERHASNSVGFWRAPKGDWSGGEVVSPGEVNRGRNTVRSILGRKSDARQAQKQEQLSLDT